MDYKRGVTRETADIGDAILGSVGEPWMLFLQYVEMTHNELTIHLGLNDVEDPGSLEGSRRARVTES